VTTGLPPIAATVTEAGASGPSGDGPVLPPGAPGKGGDLYLELAPRAGRTRLGASRRRVPLHVGRVLHLEPNWRELAQLTITMPTGGMVQGDEIGMHVVARPGARAHVTSQSATRAYRCPGVPIRQRIVLVAEDDALLEWWPDPLIPYADASVDQQIEMVVDGRGTLLVADCWLAGRVARGEVHQYASLRLDARARRPEGTLLFRDTVRLSTAHVAVGAIGQLGEATAMGTFFLLGPDLARSLEQPLTTALAAELPSRAGVTRIPNDAGLLVRLLTRRSEDVRHAQRLILRIARRHLFGRGLAEDAKPG